MKRRCVLTARLALAAGILLIPSVWAGVASGHSNGQVELFVAAIKVEKVQGGFTVSVNLVDQDSGTPAPGFGVGVKASASTGKLIGPLKLVDAASSASPGWYSAVVALTPGEWEIVATAELGGSALPAVAGATKIVKFRIASDGSVHTAGSGGSGSGILIGLVVGGVVLVGVLLLVRAVRRRTARSSGVEAPASP